MDDLQDMMTPPTPEESPGIRQSCDRCHRQKLRCTRATNSHGACQRCQRRGTRCTYSASLPKGRPSRYNTLDLSSKFTPKNTSAVTSSSSCTPSSTSTFPQPVASNLEDCIQTEVIEQTTSTQAVHNPDTSIGDDEAFFAVNAFPDAIFWPECPETGQIDSDAVRGPSETLAFNSLNAANTPSNRSSGAFASPISSFLHDGDDSPSRSLDVVITHLSLLTVRLSILHRSSCNMVTACHATNIAQHQGTSTPLIDDTAFRSMASWLVQVSAEIDGPFASNTHELHSTSVGSYLRFPYDQLSGPKTTGEILQDTFSTTHCLLKILRFIQDSIGSVSSGNIEPCTTSITIHPLIMASHALLLNIYISVLSVLEYSASIPPESGSSSTADGNESTPIAPVLSEVRFVLVLHICSYLIERQNAAVFSSVSSLRSLTKPSQQQESCTSGSHSPKTTSDLETEVQQRLVRLRHTLHV